MPFAILELLFNTVNEQNALDLAVLFALLWVLPTAFIVILHSIVRSVRAGDSIVSRPINVLAVASLVVIAMAWGGIVIDQLPCFTAVPNCD